MQTLKFIVATLHGTAHLIIVGLLYSSLTHSTVPGEVDAISYTSLSGKTLPITNHSFTGQACGANSDCVLFPNRPSTKAELAAPPLVYSSAALLLLRDVVLRLMQHDYILMDALMICFILATQGLLLYTLGNFWSPTYDCQDNFNSQLYTCHMQVHRPGSVSYDDLKSIPPEERSFVLTVLSIVLLLALANYQLFEGMYYGTTHYLFLTQLVPVNVNKKAPDEGEDGKYVKI